MPVKVSFKAISFEVSSNSRLLLTQDEAELEDLRFQHGRNLLLGEPTALHFVSRKEKNPNYFLQGLT